MPKAVLRDGPMPGHEIDVPTDAFALTLRLGGSTVEFERAGYGDGGKIYYNAKSVTERVKTPKKRAAKKVPAPRFSGGDSEGDTV